MAEDFIPDYTKKQQIDKIFQVIDKNKDNKEICKIAFETLNSKCLENPSIIFPILSNFLVIINKGNLKLIEEGNHVLLNFFQDFSFKELTKILLDNDFKKNLLKLIKDGKTEYPLCINPTSNEIEELTSVPYLTINLFKKDFDINKYAPLYKEDSNAVNNKMASSKTEEFFSKSDINILFQNDPNLKNELFGIKNEKSKSKEMDIDDFNESRDKNKIPVEELYKKNSQELDMKFSNDNREEDLMLDESSRKMRKLNNNSKEIIVKINLFPFLGFILEILKYDHMPYLEQRNCSITLLQLLEKQYDKIFYYPYEIKINYLSDFSDISNITVLGNTNKKYDKFKEIMQMNMMTQLLYNSIIDKVLDTSSGSNDYICLFKDINLKVLSLIINDYKNEKLKKEFYQKTIMLLNIFTKDTNDWQPLFAILTLYKYISFISDGINFVEFGLLDILNNIIDTDNEEIRNLIIKILDKALSADMINRIKIDTIMTIFDKFVDLNGKYDDIDIGVKDYLNCLYNFTNYFRNRPENRDICFKKIQKIVTNEKFILYALNKMEDVRIKFYEVINQLIVDKFYFEKDILEKIILLAFQGLCFETNKVILNAQRAFLDNVLAIDDPQMLTNAFNTFQNNSEIIFYLFLKENINDVKKLYIPSGITDQNAFSLVSELYKPFFLNDIQKAEIRAKYLKKISNIIPIISHLICIQTQFVELVYVNLNVHIPIKVTKEISYVPLNLGILLFLRIVLYYLLDIRIYENKILLLSDEILKYFCDLKNLNEMSIQIHEEYLRNNLINDINNLKKFSTDKIKYPQQNLDEIINCLKTRKLLLIKPLKNSMKEIYAKIENNKNESLMKSCKDYIKNINDAVLKIEKLQNTAELRTKIRGYVSACLFLHSAFSGQKIAEISSITNSFLNCLKINNKESDIFVYFLVNFLSTIDNKNIFNKIIFTFFENNIKLCEDWINNKNKEEKSKEQNMNGNKENKEKEFKCYPMKYFFKKYDITYKKILDIQKIIELYIQNLKEQKCPNIYEKLLILLFLVPSKISIKLIKQEKFITLLTNIIPILHKKEEHIKYLTKIIYCAENLFENYNLKAILDFLFTQINHQNISIFKLINSILENNEISIMSIDYIFTVLNYINSPNEEIRKISTAIFSKQMKIISILKFSDNYSQITEKNSDAKSLQFISNIFNQNINDTKELNVKLKLNLRHYQLIGINWLLFLGNYGLGLALCDDMGLGKSIQTLVAVAESTIEYKKKNGKSRPSLIICPNTLIINWINEAEKFFDDQTVHIEKDLDKLHSKKTYNTQTLIYICSYEKARDNFSNIFDNINFYYLVLDEAHIIKNPKTKMYQSINKIQADKRIILTGTPIQNNVMELWALFNFLMPNFLGSSNDFEIKYQKKIAQNIKKLNVREDVQENIFQTSLQEIRKRIKPFILRRLKSEVLQELPEKIISDYNCEMEPDQRNLYEKYNVMYNNNKLNTEKSALSVIDKLRKICNHPYLLDNLEQRLVTKNEKEMMIEKSGKLKALEELLISLGFESAMNQNSFINSSSYENKLLIFTQMTKMCNYLEIFFKYKFPGLKTLTLTGDIKNKEKRGEIVNTFNNDPSVNALILTINIGGVGLNLTSANVVIMYDHSWNPSKDMQAIDRAHRLGQKKIVQVFRLITINSIEEQLISLQTFKKYISNNVVDTSKIHEDKVNLNSVMQSFEEFSKDKINSMKEKNKDKNKKMSKYEELLMDDENEMKQEMEIEYLQKLVES